MVIKKAICMHEEDYGILWKHTEYRTDHLETRRSRRLVVSFFCTIANYECAASVAVWLLAQLTPDLQSCMRPSHGLDMHTVCRMTATID